MRFCPISTFKWNIKQYLAKVETSKPRTVQKIVEKQNKMRNEQK